MLPTARAAIKIHLSLISTFFKCLSYFKCLAKFLHMYDEILGFLLHYELSNCACYACGSYIYSFQPCDSQPISIQRRNQEKKEHKPLRTSWFSQRNVSAMFGNHTIMLFWLWNKHVLAAWSVFHGLCSHDLNVLRAIGFYLNYPQINKVGKWAGDSNLICRQLHFHAAWYFQHLPQVICIACGHIVFV